MTHASRRCDILRLDYFYDKLYTTNLRETLLHSSEPRSRYLDQMWRTFAR